MLGRKKTRSRKRKSETFLSKLYDILNDDKHKNIISWDLEGKKIVIFDSMKLCKEILPKFYKHRNYSSFIRQLNLYGFRKTKGINENLEIYEHKNFFKNITKEQIKQIANVARHDNMMKNIDTFIIKSKCEETIDTEFNQVPDDKMINYLTKKIDENSKNVLEAQKEIEKLKNEIKNLNNEFIECKNNLKSNKIVISKIMKNYVNNHITFKNIGKITNIKEFFNRCLYHWKLYSPFVYFDSNKLTNIIKQNERNEIKQNINDKNYFSDFNRYNNDLNNNKDMDDITVLNGTNNIQFFDLSLNYSNSFINNRFCK